MSTPYQEPLAAPPLVAPALIPLLTHELRTPLAAITGFTALLLRHHQHLSPREQRELLEEIAVGCERLDGAVAYAVALSEIAAGTQRHPAAVVDLAQVVRIVVAQAAADLPRWHDQVSILPDGLLPVVGDARELARALTHLLDLARQSAPAGGSIALVVQPWQRTTACPSAMANVPYWEIQIRDVGSDAAAASLQRLLQDHAGADLDLVHYSPRLLLGFLYSTWIIASHGGHLWVAQHPTQGNTLHLIVPARDRAPRLL